MSHVFRPTHLAYLAGIIDGEGHVAIPNSRGSGSRGVIVCMADMAILEWCHDHFGGTISSQWKQERGRPRRIWGIYGYDQLELVVPAVRPYVVLKGPELDLLLKAVGLGRQKPTGQGPEAWRAWRAARDELAIAVRVARAARK